VDSSCEFGNEHSGFINAGKLWSGYTTGGISSSAQLHTVSLLRKDNVVPLLSEPLWYEIVEQTVKVTARTK
jgi:hypothetical protein